ncbi:MAG: hydrogenase maturation protease [Bacteroidetes bacterium HGW-Bacteroidetes-4]|jgi:hydrogenase maturation protease|nr:MAG: hydrogenase maturation protease [Bacteroidetes bacterium HGW-Bacteroidetes-4]
MQHPTFYKTLILGLGNILMGNEGIGVKAIEYMENQPLPEQVTLLDGGTGGFHLLHLFNEYESFIMIDATLTNEEQGTIKVIKPKFASDFPRSLTSHDIGLRDLMQSAELLGDLPEISLITINIKELDTVKIGLSDELNQLLPKVYQTVLSILENKKNSKL